MPSKLPAVVIVSLIPAAIVATGSVGLAAEPGSSPPGPTSGELALLVERPTDPPAVDLLRRGIANTDPDVRATAARMIAVLGADELLPEVRSAIGGEANAEAAKEEARALSRTTQWEDLKLAIDAAGRLHELDTPVAMLVAETLGPDAIRVYASLPPGVLRSRLTLAQFFRVASRGSEGILQRAALDALGRGDTVAFYAVRDAADQSQVELGPDVLLRVLQKLPTKNADEALWYFVATWSRGAPEEGGALLGAVEGYATGHAGTLDDEGALGAEMLRRILGAEGKSEARWIDYLEHAEASHLDDLPLAARLQERYLSRKERRALLRHLARVFPDKDVKKDLEAALELPEWPKSAWLDFGNESDRFFVAADHPRGMLEGILKASGCEPGSEPAVYLGNGTVDAAGRFVVQSEEARGPVSAACRKAGDLLFRTSFPANGVRGAAAGEIRTAVFLPTRTRFECLTREEPPLDPRAPIGITNDDGGENLSPDIRPPRRIRHVDPVYPEPLRRAGITGKAILEIVVRRDGCVENLRVLKSARDAFTFAALWAVSQWEYEPARGHGYPVKVYMVVVLDFTLRHRAANIHPHAGLAVMLG